MAEYVMISNLEIDDTTKASSKEGQSLRKAFINGVSGAVKSYGKVEVEYEDAQQKSESFHYSILESYLNISDFLGESDILFEKKGKKGKKGKNKGKNKGKKGKSKGNNKGNNSNQSQDSNTNNQSNQDNSEEQTNSQENNTDQEQDNKEQDSKEQDDKEQDNKEQDDKLFRLGSFINIIVKLDKEGFTKWKVAVDDRVTKDIKKIISAIKSKNFKAAVAIASNISKGLGLIPMSAKTFIYTKAKCGCPFIGHCRYAIDSGTEENNDNDISISIAVAPIDSIKGKPNEDTVFESVYDIIGDISGGKFSQALSSFISKNNDNDRSNDVESSDDIEDEVSDYLHKNFKCVGDHTMYKNFCIIRNFIDKSISSSKLIYNPESSDTPEKYSKVSALKNTLIVY